MKLAIPFFALMFSAGIALASHPETPAAPPAGVKLVDAKGVQELQAKGAIIVDTRKASEYGEGTIKGAISVPYDPEKSAKDANFDSSQDKFDMSKLKDKNGQIVVFCNAGSCWKSYKSAVVLSKNGYKNVHWYREGFPDWKARKLPVE
jgi:rhodanese-related sulfurtransferase